MIIVLTLALLVLYALFRQSSNIAPYFVVGVLLAGIFLSLSDSGLLSDIFSAYEDKSLTSGGDIATASSRTGRWSLAFNNMFTYPLGWGNGSYRLYYAHNLWLDVDRVAGIIPFALLLYLTCSSIFKLYLLIKTGNQTIVPIILAFYTAIILSCLVEPVIEGLAMYFFIYMFFVGMVEQKKKKRQRVKYLENTTQK